MILKNILKGENEERRYYFMEKYEAPTVEIIYFEAEDIITTSDDDIINMNLEDESL